ncbi:MAG: response regulator [Bacteroidales bacterium]|nr:response regulator [Bacteroidales bacterium]
MDIQLPVMNGLEATQIIRAQNPQVPIIAQTAYAMPSDKVKAIEAGCTDYIAKPIDPKLLFEKLNRYL